MSSDDRLVSLVRRGIPGGSMWVAAFGPPPIDSTLENSMRPSRGGPIDSRIRYSTEYLTESQAVANWVRDGWTKHCPPGVASGAIDWGTE